MKTGHIEKTLDQEPTGTVTSPRIFPLSPEAVRRLRRVDEKPQPDRFEHSFPDSDVA